MLDPRVEPKPLPLIVTDAPTGPHAGETLVILGGETTVKLDPLLFTPLANTTTFPVVAPDGTVVAILVALQLVIVAAVPLKLTMPEPCVERKLDPVIVTAAPTAPEVTDRLVMLGAGLTVKFNPLLFTPLANTTTFPDVAPLGTVVPILVSLQLVTVAAVPWNFTVPLPCVEPKFVPVIVTDAPIAPDVGDKVLMVGFAAWAQLIEERKHSANAKEISSGFHGFRPISLKFRQRARPRDWRIPTQSHDARIVVSTVLDKKASAYRSDTQQPTADFSAVPIPCLVYTNAG